MTDNDTFRLDNVVIETAPTLFGSKNPQLYLPGMEPFGPFDLWAMLGCFSLLDAEGPTKPVRITLTRFVETLDFARTVSEALGHYRTFPSDAYDMVKEALHRLFTVEAVFVGEWTVKTGKVGRPRKQVVEYHSRILTSYAYIWPPGVTPPDQLAEGKRRNVNRARTLKNEVGPPVYVLATGPRPEAIEFRVSEELLRGLTKEGPNIGATVLPVKVFQLRRKIPSRDSTTIKLILLVARQTKQTWKIGLDKLTKRLYPDDKAHATRNRDAVLKSLRLVQSFGVIASFSHDPKTDRVTIVKAADWHFPAREGDEEEDE